MQLVLTSELVIEAYRHGLFPMAYSADSPHINWICPDLRGQLSIPELHIPKRLLKTIRSDPYEIKIDTAFADVIQLCGEATGDRPETWINDPIQQVFVALHESGHAHSVEAWLDDELVGGLYGLSIGSAFFGESMFSRARDASKIALVYLAARLWKGGYTLLDTQFVNDHLTQFGVYEVAHKDYKKQLDKALDKEADFILEGQAEQDLLQEYLQMRAQQAQK